MYISIYLKKTGLLNYLLERHYYKEVMNIPTTNMYLKCTAGTEFI